MPDATVFSEKIRRPRAVGLVRPRLVRPFLEATAPGVGVVIAPAGSGKTTLLSHLASAVSVPVAWFTVTPDDRDEATFTRHLARCWSDAVGIDDVAVVDVRGLAAVMQSLPSPPCLVVIDDAHELIGTPVEQGLDLFLTLRGAHVRVLIGARRAPDINLPRRQLSGSVHVVEGDDLRFRFWEVEELFATVHHEPLPPESAAELTRRTGGWAAGLRLFQFANSGRPMASRRRAVTDLGSSSRWLTAYLTRNVLAELGPARRDFMLRTCALGVMTGAQCDDLLQTTGSEAVLAELEQLQLFTSRSDDGVSYRYHEVMQRHLEATFHAEHGEAATRAWYARVGETLEAANAVDQAARAYARAEDWAAVARLLRGRNDTAPVATGEDLASVHLPESDPWLLVADARRRVRRGDLDGALTAYGAAERDLDEATAASLCRPAVAAVRRWLPGEAGELASPEGTSVRRSWTDQLRDRTRVGRPTGAPPTPQLHPATIDDRMAYGFTTFLDGDLEPAANVWRQVAADASASPFVTIVVGLCLVMVEGLAGRTDDSPRHLEQLEREAEEGSLPWLARLTRGLLAAVLARPPSPPWRVDSVDGLVAECDRDGDAWGAALIEAAGALAADQHGAAPRFARAAARFTALEAPVLALWADALATRGNPAATAPTVVARARALRVPAAAALVKGMRHVPSSSVAGVAPAPTPAVEVRCFGGLQISVADQLLDLTVLRPRARGLLRLLALSPGRDRPRDWLVDVLWPDAGPATGTHRLQVAVSSVRHVFAEIAGGPTVRRTGDAYALVLPDGAQADVVRFEGLARSARRVAGDSAPAAAAALDAALELYTDDLLPEENALEPVVTERERLRLIAAGLALDLAKTRRELGFLGPAVDAARRATELDAYSDAGWLLLAELHGVVGDHSAAARVRQRHDRAQRELGTTSG